MAPASLLPKHCNGGAGTSTTRPAAPLCFVFDVGSSGAAAAATNHRPRNAIATRTVRFTTGSRSSKKLEMLVQSSFTFEAACPQAECSRMQWQQRCCTLPCTRQHTGGANAAQFAAFSAQHTQQQAAVASLAVEQQANMLDKQAPRSMNAGLMREWKRHSPALSLLYNYLQPPA